MYKVPVFTFHAVIILFVYKIDIDGNFNYL